MKFWIFLSIGFAALLLAIVAFSLPAGAPAQGLDPEWETLASGIEYRQYHLSGPNNVFVARMAISNTNVTLESGIGSGYLASGHETVRSIAARYDQALSQWGESEAWGGARSDVIVAINGDYFNGSALPQGGMVQGGWYIKRFTDTGGRSGFGWKFSRTPFVGECVIHRLEKQTIHFADGSTQQFNGINVGRDSDQLIVYTPQYDTNTRADSSGLEVLIDLNQPAIIYPEPKYFSGTVKAIRPNQGATSMFFDQIVLSAQGSAADILAAHVAVGDVIQISQEVTSRQEADCDAPLASVDWSKTYTSVGGDYYFLKESQVKTYDCAKTPGFCKHDPRTAIAYNGRYVYFIVVDGRDQIDSIGMTVEELSIFARDTLSATHGVSQDGGGSSTMVVNGLVKNDPFCNNYGCVSKIFLPLVADGGPPSLAQSQAYPAPGYQDLHWGVSGRVTGTAAAYERGVANGMMMVIVEPKQVSDRGWAAGQDVIITTPANLRLGPGTNFASQLITQAGIHGTVQPHSLNGILAKGYYWWKVKLDNGSEGWIVQDALATP